MLIQTCFNTHVYDGDTRSVFQTMQVCRSSIDIPHSCNLHCDPFSLCDKLEAKHLPLRILANRIESVGLVD
jgi:hypothetical protein